MNLASVGSCTFAHRETAAPDFTEFDVKKIEVVFFESVTLYQLGLERLPVRCWHKVTLRRSFVSMMRLRFPTQNSEMLSDRLAFHAHQLFDP